MTTVPSRIGSCLCGSVEYVVTGEPLVARICWCRVCQKISGNGTANAIFPSAALEVRGQTCSYTSVADSGNQITRHFCPSCGIQVYAGSSASPQFRVIRIGTLQDPSSIKPEVNIWSSSAPAWACLDLALKQETGQPAPPKPSVGA